MRGDASDGLPGVAGVGEKTAATLLQRFGDIDAHRRRRRRTRTPRWARARAARSRPRSTTSRSRPPSAPSPATSTSTAARLALPSTPRDPARLAELVEQWGLETPAARLTDVLAG